MARIGWAEALQQFTFRTLIDLALLTCKMVSTILCSDRGQYTDWTISTEFRGYKLIVTIGEAMLKPLAHRANRRAVRDARCIPCFD